ADEVIDEVRRRLVDPPGVGAITLVFRRELPEEVAQLEFVERREAPAHVRHRVVPGRHRRMVLVPGRGHIRMRSLEDGDHVGRFFERARLGIRPRYVPEKALAPGPALDHEGDVAHVNALRAGSDEPAARIRLDERAKRLRIVDTEGGGDVQAHAVSLRSSAASWSMVPTLS